MVKVRRDVVEVKVRIGVAVDVVDTTRIAAARGGGDEERRCDSIARLNLNLAALGNEPKAGSS